MSSFHIGQAQLRLGAARRRPPPYYVPLNNFSDQAAFRDRRPLGHPDLDGQDLTTGPRRSITHDE
jgi:hypothetical protein